MDFSINFTARNIKTVLPKTTNQIRKEMKQFEVKQGELDGFFRQDELFDPAKDEITSDYFQYGHDDLFIHENLYDPNYDIIGEIEKSDRMY